MKKYLQYILIATISAVLLSACNKDEDNTVTLTAIVADQLNGGNAKVYINETGGVKYGCWQNGDTININGAKKYLAVTSGESLTAAINDVDASNTGYTAGYPYGKTTYSGTPKSISIDIPAVQEYISADDYSGTGASAKQRLLCPMAAYCGSNGSSLKFHNVGAVLKVTVSNSYEELLTLHSVEVESEDATVPLSGTCSVTMNDAGEISEATYEGSSKTTLDLSNAGKSLAKNGDPIDLYIPIMPIKESKKTKITIHVYAKGTPDGASSENKYTFHGKSASTVWVDCNQIGAVSINLSSSNKTANDPYFWGQGYSWCPFLIEDYEDLKQLSALVAVEDNDGTYNNSNCYYKQTKDITITDANWGTSSRLAVGSTTNAFKAKYDGNNDTIKMAITSATKNNPVGAFGVVGDGAEINNVVISGSINSGSIACHIGGLAGMVSGGVSLSNIKSSTTITSTNTGNSYGAGGIIGCIDADNKSVSLLNCNNSGGITVSGFPVGGIVGLHKTGTLNLTSCVNKNAISQGYKSSNVYSGGLIGLVNAGDDEVTLLNCSNDSLGTVNGYCNVGGLIGKTGMSTIIESCKNSVSVASYTGGDSYRYNIGGMVGLADATLNFKGNNNQTGNIGGFFFVGGVVGQNTSNITVESGATVNVGSAERAVSIRYWGEYANVSNKELPIYSTDYKVSNSAATGGFVGRSYGLKIEGSINIYGSIAENATKKACVGGVVGAMYYKSSDQKPFEITSTGSVYNYASVKGTSNVGGIIGAGVEIKILGHAENNGVIEGSSEKVGGIVGSSYSRDVTINGGIIGSVCNKNTVTGSGANVGGIIGYTTLNNVSLSYCTNTGNIKGTYNVGGIIGHSYTNLTGANGKSTKIYYCTNDAQITATTSSYNGGVGGIMGRVYQALFFHIYNCRNLLKTNCYIKTTGSGTSLGIGGIVGCVEASGSIFNCFNSGNLSSETNTRSIGGICGYTWGKTDTISNCYHCGIISGTAIYASGIVGYLYNTTKDYISRINNCYTSDHLTSASDGTTKTGILYATTTTCTTYVYNCYAPANRDLTAGNATVCTKRCSTLKMSDGNPTGSLTSSVGVAAENNSTTPGTGTHSTLSSALRAWQETNSSSSPLGWPFLSWTTDDFPVFQ